MRVKIVNKLILTLFGCLFCYTLCAQQQGVSEDALIYSTDQPNFNLTNNALFAVKEIKISGNQKTKDNIILRELSFKEGEDYALPELVEKFNEAKKQLMNSGMFQNVVVSLQSLQGHDAIVNVAVKERWYIFPQPFLRIVDQNVQDWVKNQDMNLSRVNYGFKLMHRNFTGRNDRLYANFTNGYTQEIAIRYEGLRIDKQLKWSTNFDVAFGKTREINYNTEAHKYIAYKNPERFVQDFLRTSASLTYRPAIKTTHTFGVGYSYFNVSDTVFKMNEMFSFQEKQIRFPEVFYRLQYFDVDFIPYPTKGYAADIMLQKKGFDNNINLTQLTARTSASWPLTPKYFFNLRTTGVLKLPFKQPFTLQQFVGSSNMYIQGYEDYIINGVAGGFTKASLTRSLFQTSVNIPSERIKKLNHIPIKAYAKVFGNAGYIYTNLPGNHFLNNRMLYSGGVGLDIILFYDFAIKLEWSLNHLRQNGIYLHDRYYL